VVTMWTVARPERPERRRLSGVGFDVLVQKTAAIGGSGPLGEPKPRRRLTALGWGVILRTLGLVLVCKCLQQGFPAVPNRYFRTDKQLQEDGKKVLTE
jgi:hypothetical protein